MTKLVRRTSSERHWTVAAPRHNPFQPELEENSDTQIIPTTESLKIPRYLTLLGRINPEDADFAE